VLTYQKKQANLESYRSTEVNTASRLKLLIMLYEGALNFARQAEQAIRDQDMATKGVMIGKVLAIIDELSSTLDHTKAPEIAANLERLYEFAHDRLVKANLRNDVDLLHDAMRVIKTLHSAWVEVSQKPLAELATGQADQAEVTKAANTAGANSYVRISV
jgi:flagellar protein FliS